MTLSRARIVRAGDTTLEANPRTPPSHARVVRRELLEAEEHAERVRARAEAAAEQSRREAAVSNREARELAAAEGYREGLAQAALEVTRSIALEQRDNASQTERIVQLARLLAERILGRALILDDTAVGDMAHALLAEVRGARRITFRCRPDDVANLTQSLAGMAAHADVRVEPAPDLAAGCFELHTDVGTLSGSLGARLDLLAKKLCEGLGS